MNSSTMHEHMLTTSVLLSHAKPYRKNLRDWYYNINRYSDLNNMFVYTKHSIVIHMFILEP